MDIRAFSPVEGLELAADGSWEAVTPTGTVRANAVVVVAGPWSAQVVAAAGVDLDLSPVAIQMLVTERVESTMEHLVQHIGEGLSVKQVSAGQILIGGGWPARSYNMTGRSEVSYESMLGNLELAVRILPFLRNFRILRTWAGPLAVTPDEMPVIGGSARAAPDVHGSWHIRLHVRSSLGVDPDQPGQGPGPHR